MLINYIINVCKVANLQYFESSKTYIEELNISEYGNSIYRNIGASQKFVRIIFLLTFVQ